MWSYFCFRYNIANQFTFTTFVRLKSHSSITVTSSVSNYIPSEGLQSLRLSQTLFVIIFFVFCWNFLISIVGSPGEYLTCYTDSCSKKRKQKKTHACPGFPSLARLCCLLLEKVHSYLLVPTLSLHQKPSRTEDKKKVMFFVVRQDSFRHSLNQV